MGFSGLTWDYSFLRGEQGDLHLYCIVTSLFSYHQALNRALISGLSSTGAKVVNTIAFFQKGFQLVDGHW